MGPECHWYRFQTKLTVTLVTSLHRTSETNKKKTLVIRSLRLLSLVCTEVQPHYGNETGPANNSRSDNKPLVASFLLAETMSVHTIVIDVHSQTEA